MSSASLNSSLGCMLSADTKQGLEFSPIGSALMQSQKRVPFTYMSELRGERTILIFMSRGFNFLGDHLCAC